MGDALRDRYTLGALSAKAQIVEIAHEIGDFPRLAASIERDLASLEEGARPPRWRKLPVRGALSFGRTGNGQTSLSGSVEAGIPAVCQRCLAPFIWPLGSRIELRFAPPGATQPDERCETWDLDDDSVRPVDVVDELLVMALPLAARHENVDDCAAPEAARTVRETTRPFANLKAQMGAKETK